MTWMEVKGYDTTKRYTQEEIDAMVHSDEFQIPTQPQNSASQTKWVWLAEFCGYEHFGDAPPEKCPLCGVPASMFKKAE